MGKRRKFSDEYKREAVVLANQPGVTKAQELADIQHEFWRDAGDDSHDAATSSSKSLPDNLLYVNQ